MDRWSDEARRAVYDAIYARRDVREFVADEIDDATLQRLLDAAHHAPSVGFMQPWTFIVVRDLDTRRRVKELFERARSVEAERFAGERRALYDSLKLEGILESSLNICITCDPDRAGPNVLGRTWQRETDLFSTCCAIQNLWLAARVEGLGVGWVSIVDQTQLRALLGIPERVAIVAYLCVGTPKSFDNTPMLERRGWRKRLALRDVVAYERYDEPSR